MNSRFLECLVFKFDVISVYLKKVVSNTSCDEQHGLSGVSVGSVLLIVLRFCIVLLWLFVFVQCHACPVLPVSLDYPFLIVPSIFSNVY